LDTAPLASVKVKGIEMLGFFVFRIKWKKNQIMLESDTSRYSVAFERKRLKWFDLSAR